MIERASVGKEYIYQPNRGKPVRVRCFGFRRVWVECEGVEDGVRRSISLKQLSPVPLAEEGTSGVGV